MAARFSRDLKVPSGDVEDDRRLGVRQAQVVVEHEHGALLRGQTPKASLQLVTHGGRPGHRRADARQARRRGSPRPGAADPPRHPVAGADEQPVEPGIEAVGIADRADVQPGGRRATPARRRRPGRRPQDQSGGAVQPVGRSVASAVKASWSPVLARRTRSRCIGDPCRGGHLAALTHHEEGGIRIVHLQVARSRPCAPGHRARMARIVRIRSSRERAADLPDRSPPERATSRTPPSRRCLRFGRDGCRRHRRRTPSRPRRPLACRSGHLPGRGSACRT